MNNKYLAQIDDSFLSVYSVEELIELIRDSELELLKAIESNLKLEDEGKIQPVKKIKVTEFTESENIILTTHQTNKSYEIRFTKNMNLAAWHKYLKPPYYKDYGFLGKKVFFDKAIASKHWDRVLTKSNLYEKYRIDIDVSGSQDDEIFYNLLRHIISIEKIPKTHKSRQGVSGNAPTKHLS